MSSRSARNSLLAAGAAVGVVAAVLRVVAASLSLSDFLSFPLPVNTALKVATGFEVLAWVFAAGAFGTALVAFLLRTHSTRMRILAASAGLFAVYGVALLVDALIELVQQWGNFGETWTFRAAQCAEAAAGLSVVLAGVLVAIGLLSSRRDRPLGWGSIALAGSYGLLAVGYSFALAGYLTFPFGSIPAEFSWGIGTRAAGQLLVAVGAVVAGVAFFRSSERREREEPWQVKRFAYSRLRPECGPVPGSRPSPRSSSSERRVALPSASSSRVEG